MVKNLISNISIRRKLNILALITTGLALFVAFLALAYSSEKQFEDSMKRELQSLARVVGQAAEASIVFNDQSSAQRFLDALSVKENILGAAVAHADGSILASHTRPKAVIPDYNSLAQRSGVWCDIEYCYTVTAVNEGQGGTGRIFLISDRSGLNQQLAENAKVLALTFVFSFAGALIIANFLQRIISRPLRELADLAGRVSRQRDYSLRIKNADRQPRTDEIGVLTSGINHMLTQIQERDVELTRAKEIAEQASKAKSEFVANTSHEIRTPLNNIIGFTEMLAETVSTPKDKRYIELIKASAESLLGVINDILDISKIEAGRLEFSITPTDLRAHLLRVIGPLEVQAKRKGLDFHFTVDEKLPHELEVDGLRLGQVVINLVNNAIKFTEPPGGVIVRVQTLNLMPEAATILIEVQDTGVGIPEEAQNYIFEAFKQADASTTRRFGGTGLGLAISSRIVKMMGGEISVKSEEGQGSVFQFALTLPTVAGTELLARGAAGEGASSGDTEISGNSEFADTRILLVEDNALSREIAVHRLRKFGFNVTTAKNGKEAVKLSKDEAFDLILMDCQMPEMDGFEATFHVRAIDAERGRRTPIVALTAHAIEGYREMCLKAGMDDYVTKPVNEEQLLAFLRRFPA